MGFQFGLLDTNQERETKLKAYEEQLSFLPVSPLQEKHAEETPTLTEVEYQIMDMTLKGFEITDIQRVIFRSIAGVKWRLSQVYWKFGAHNRLQLIKKAASTGLQFYVREYDKKTKEYNTVKHSFHLGLNMQAHVKDKNEAP